MQVRVTLLLFLAVTLNGAVTNLRVDETTNTQAIIRYTAPSEAACTSEVSEESDYSPVVHDVNATLFNGSNSDNREGAITNGHERIFPVGKRKIEQATNGLYYSRALQTDTIHYVRVTCGGDQATTTFRTATLPVGASYTEVPVHDSGGVLIHPYIDYTDRTVGIVDPETGVLIKQMSMARDGAASPEVFNTNYLNQDFSSASGTNWTSASEALTANTTYASYAGASCGGTCDWLLVSKTTTSTYPYNSYGVDLLQLHILGYGDDAAEANRTIEACITLDGSTCDPLGESLTVALPQSTPATVDMGSDTPIYTWRPVGVINITGSDIRTALTLRWLIRKTTSTGTIYIDRVAYDMHASPQHGIGSGGSFERCSTVADSGGWYKCSSYQGGISDTIFAVNGDTGEVRHLGWLLMAGNQQCVADNFVWSTTDPNIGYCRTSTDILRELTFDSGNTAVSSTSYTTKTENTLLSGVTTTTAVGNFVTAHSVEYDVAFSGFACGLAASNGQYITLQCRRANQDAYAWSAIYDTVTDTIIAAAPIYNSAAGRWCGDHAVDPTGDSRVVLVNVKPLTGGATGRGPYTTTLAADVTTTGQTAWTVSGEPTSAYADTSLQNAAIGDIFQIGSERLRISGKSGNDWTVVRAQDSTSPSTYSSGATITMLCGNAVGPNSYYTTSTGGGTYNWIWRFLDDPYGSDTTGNYQWANRYYNHATIRGNVIAGAGNGLYDPTATRILQEQRDPTTYVLPESLAFAGKAATASGNTYQSHPTYHSVNAPAYRGILYTDSRPFVGGNLLSPATVGCNPTDPPYPTGCAVARVSGTTHVYRYIPNGGVPINPKHITTLAMCGTHILVDKSGPSSTLTDSDDFHYCYSSASNECVTGSNSGEMYVSCSTITVYYCTGGETSTATNDACVVNLSANGLASYQQDVANPKWRTSRMLARSSLGYRPRSMGAFATTKALANGKWALVERYRDERRDLGLMKIPRLSYDSLDRSYFIPVPLTLGSVPAGTDNVVVEFGYAENGAPSNFYCTTRAEKCLANTAALSQTNPFRWPTEDGGETSVTGLSCASGCTLTIPAISGRILYYRLIYRNASNATVLTGPIRTTAVN